MAVKVRSARHELYRRLVAERESKHSLAVVVQVPEPEGVAVLDESVIQTLVPTCDVDVSPILAPVSGSKRLRKTRYDEPPPDGMDNRRPAPAHGAEYGGKTRKLAFEEPVTHDVEQVVPEKDRQTTVRPISWSDERVEVPKAKIVSGHGAAHIFSGENSVEKSVNSSSSSLHLSRRSTMAASTKAHKSDVPVASKLPRSFSVAVSGLSTGTGRTREERAAMPGHACTCCTAFYDALGGQFDPHVLKDAASRHRAHCAPDATPPHYWDLDDDSLPAAADIPTHPRNNHFADSHKPQR
jgi:hypothetical protein